MRTYMVAIAGSMLASSASLPAFAQEAQCSGNDWFCSSPAAERVDEEVVEQAQPEEARPEATGTTAPVDTKAPTVVVIIVQPQTPVVVPRTTGSLFSPPPMRSIVRKAPPQVAPTPTTLTTPKKKKAPSQGGFEFRAQRLGFMLDPVRKNPRSSDAVMYGGGAGLRIAVRNNLEVDGQNEALFGTDFNGHDRGEIGVSLHLARFINPDNWLRFYTIGGVLVGIGNVTSDQQTQLTPKVDEDGKYYASYGFTSWQAGVGAEMRISSAFSFRTDALVALRWRFAATGDAPEYWDNRSDSGVNTYPALLLRAGVTIW